MFSQVMGTLQGVRHSSTALLELIGPLCQPEVFFLETPDTMFLNEVCLNVTEWSTCVSLRVNYSNNLMNMVWDFVMSVPWTFVGKGRREAAQYIPERWSIINENLVSCCKLSLVRSPNYQQRGVYWILRIVLIPVVRWISLGTTRRQADLSYRWRQMSWEKTNTDCPLWFSVGELNIAYACCIIFNSPGFFFFLMRYVTGLVKLLKLS